MKTLDSLLESAEGSSSAPSPPASGEPSASHATPPAATRTRSAWQAKSAEHPPRPRRQGTLRVESAHVRASEWVRRPLRGGGGVPAAAGGGVRGVWVAWVGPHRSLFGACRVDGGDELDVLRRRAAGHVPRLVRLRVRAHADHLVGVLIEVKHLQLVGVTQLERGDEEPVAVSITLQRGQCSRLPFQHVRGGSIELEHVREGSRLCRAAHRAARKPADITAAHSRRLSAP